MKNISDSALIVMEPNMNSVYHSEINAGFIDLFEKVYPGTLIFISDARHKQCVESIKSLDRWVFIKIRVFSYRPLNFILNELLLIIRILVLVSMWKRGCTIVLLGIMPISHIFVSILNSFLGRRIFLCLHGQMEAYLPDTKIGLTRYYYRLSKFVFKRNDGLIYVVFGKAIQRNIQFLFSGRRSTQIVIPQPYVFSGNGFRCAPRNVFKLAWIGRFSKSKNVEAFYNLIEFVNHLIAGGSIQLVIIGSLEENIPPRYSRFIKIKDKLDTANKFTDEIKLIDFALFFPDHRFYRATPSGVFFDCIKMSVPILTLRNDFALDYFDGQCQPGEVFDDVTAMAKYIIEITNDYTILSERWSKYQSSLSWLQKKMSTESLSKYFSEQL